MPAIVVSETTSKPIHLTCASLSSWKAINLIMAEKSMSDAESDSELEEVLSSSSDRQRLPVYVQGLVSKNQFDRLQRLVDVLAQPGNSSTDQLELQDVLGKVLWTSAIKGQDEAVRCVFRHLRARRSDFSVSWLTWLEQRAVARSYSSNDGSCKFCAT